MTKVKKIVAAAVAALAIGTIGTGVYASTYKLPDYRGSFKFKFTGYGGTQSTSELEKDTSRLSNAKVQATGGYVSEGNKIFVDVCYRVPNTNKTVIATETKAITSPVDNLSLEYIVARGEGSLNFLVGSGTYYGSEVAGSWEP